MLSRNLSTERKQETWISRENQQMLSLRWNMSTDWNGVFISLCIFCLLFQWVSTKKICLNMSILYSVCGCDYFFAEFTYYIVIIDIVKLACWERKKNIDSVIISTVFSFVSLREITIFSFRCLIPHLRHRSCHTTVTPRHHLNLLIHV